MSSSEWAQHQRPVDGVPPDGANRLLIALAIAIGLHLLLLLRLPDPLPEPTPVSIGELRFDLIGGALISPTFQDAELAFEDQQPTPEPPSQTEVRDLAPSFTESAFTGVTKDPPADKGISESLDPLPELVSNDGLESIFPAPEPVRIQPNRLDLNDILNSRDAAIASLAPMDPAGAAGGVRRLSVKANSSDYRYASYLEAWQRKVERIGNLNYPEEARKRNLYGSLQVQVSVRTDGSLEGVRVLRSSGEPLLDQAAIDIVRLAAPFAPLPETIRAETDVLDIHRGWQFRRGAGFGASD